MTTGTTDPQRVWAVLAIVAVLVILPGFGMMGAGPIMGVAIAVISFVGSMGNVPFAVAL